jgi:hypothetical protein
VAVACALVVGLLSAPESASAAPRKAVVNVGALAIGAVQFVKDYLGMLPFNALACPPGEPVSAETCYLVAGRSPKKNLHYTGVVVPVKDGHLGSPLSVPEAGLMTSISCPTGPECVALSSSLEGRAAVVWLRRGKVVKSQAVPNNLSLMSLYCSSISSCLLVGSDDQTGVLATLTGDHLKGQQVRGPSELDTVSCASTTSCLAVGTIQDKRFKQGAAVYVPVVGGTPGAAKVIANPRYLTSPACNWSRGACASLGTYLSDEAVEVVIKGGASTVAPLGILVDPASGGIVCAGPGHCLLFGATLSLHHQHAFVAPITGTKVGRRTLVPGLASVSWVVCPAPGSCLALGTKGGDVAVYAGGFMGVFSVRFAG